MATIRTRRPPPPLLRGRVARAELRTPRLRQVTVVGSELVGFERPLPAASVRLLLPRHGELVLPEWNGNEYLHADGARPHLRTLTPLRVDPGRGEVDVAIVLHGDGPLARWAVDAAPGDEVALSGPGRGLELDERAERYVLAGDESALPAIGTILHALPETASATVLIEVAEASAELALDGPAGARISWHVADGGVPGDALVTALADVSIAPGDRVWVAGEAAAVQRVRRHLFDDLGHPRAHATVRGYWKHGRASEGGEP